MALVDITEDAKLLLRAIEDTRGKFGFNLPIEVLLGRRNARISKQGFDSLECHGRGKHKSEEHWKAVSRSLVQELLVDSRNGGGGKGFRGKGAGMSIYCVSNLGRQLLDGRGGRVMADLEAESNNIEMERARRAARTASRKEKAATQSPRPEPTPARSAAGGRGSPAAAPPAAAESEWLPARREQPLPQMAAPPQMLVQPHMAIQSQTLAQPHMAAPPQMLAQPHVAVQSQTLAQPPEMADFAFAPQPAEAFGHAYGAQEVAAPAAQELQEPAAKRRKLPASISGPVASAPAPQPPPAAAPAPAPARAAPAPAGARAAPAAPAPRENGLKPPPQTGAIPAPTPLPPALDAALMPFQRSGVAFAVRREGRVLIGDDMGLGKTIQAIATCCAFRKDWPVLVVVPNSVRLVWADELERWIPDLGPGGVNVVRNSQDLIELTKGTASFHIVTYGILTRNSPVRDFLRDSTSFGCLVVDESHMIKTRSAQRTKEVLHIARGCARVLLLSGTPALARPLELYTQIEAVSPGIFSSYSAFTQRYCNPKWTPFGMDFTGASNLEELHGHLRPIMVRRLKVDVLNELPSKRRQRVQLEIDREAINTFTSLKEELEGTDGQAPVHKQRVLMQMYKETGLAKIGAVSEYVEDLINGGCKFLVFGHHLSMLDALEAVAVRSKVKFIRIDGSVSSAERQRRVSQFQADDSVRVAVLGLLAAGVGITLTAASTVVFAELHWTPGVLVQAEDRAHRIGQKNSVNIHYLIGSGTIDDIIWPAVSKKVEVVSTMCDGKKESLIAKLLAAGRASGEAVEAAAEAAAAELAIEEGDGENIEDLVAVVDGMTPRRPPRRRAESPPKSEKSKAKPDRPEKKESAYSVLSMLQGKRPNAKAERWACGSCGARSVGEAEACSNCGAARGAAAPDSAPRRRPPAPTAGGAPGRQQEDEAIESASDAEAQDEAAKEAQEFEQYSFCVVRITNRVHLLHGDGRPMGCNFKLADWEAQRDIGPPLPEPLLQDAALVRTTDAFLREWSSLRSTEQRQLVDQTLHMPLWKTLRQKKAENVHSTRRLRQKPVAAPDGSSICSYCNTGKCAPGSAFCSPACEDKANVRSSMAVARNQIFAIQHGVCQVCGLDAHALFERVKAMTPPERHQELLRAGFKERKAMLENPTEGMFWQADHILPVAEGGGECDITNLRTLCTMCHAKETKRLQDRLRQAGWGKNSADIRTGLVRAAAPSAARPEETSRRKSCRREQPTGGQALEVEPMQVEQLDEVDVEGVEENEVEPMQVEQLDEVDVEGVEENEEGVPEDSLAAFRKSMAAKQAAAQSLKGPPLLPVLPEIDLGEDDDEIDEAEQ